MNFAETAHQLAGHIGALFGWPPDVFWQATPAELGALLCALSPLPAAPDAADLERLKDMFPDG